MNFKIYFIAIFVFVVSSSISSKSWASDYIYYDHYDQTRAAEGRGIFIKRGRTKDIWIYIDERDKKNWRSVFSGFGNGNYSPENVSAEYHFHYVVENGQKCRIANNYSAMPNEDYAPNKGTVNFNSYNGISSGSPFIQINGARKAIDIRTFQNSDFYSKAMCILLYDPRVVVKLKRGNSYGHLTFRLNKTGKIRGNGTDIEGRRASKYVSLNVTRIPKIRVAVVIKSEVNPDVLLDDPVCNPNAGQGNDTYLIEEGSSLDVPFYVDPRMKFTVAEGAWDAKEIKWFDLHYKAFTRDGTANINRDYKAMNNQILWWGNNSFYIMNRYSSNAYITIKDYHRKKVIGTTAYDTNMSEKGVKCRYYYIDIGAPFYKSEIITKKYMFLNDQFIFEGKKYETQWIRHNIFDANGKSQPGNYYTLESRGGIPSLNPHFIIRMIIHSKQHGDLF